MQQGSTALTVLVAITAASSSALYLSNVRTQQWQEIRNVAETMDRELGQISDINTLARFRSLINNTKLPDGTYESAVYPENYFETKWVLKPNDTITDKIKGDSSGVKVIGANVTLSQLASDTSYDELVKVFNPSGKFSAVSAVSTNATVVLKKVNFPTDPGSQGLPARSIDIELIAKGRKIAARVPLQVPVASNPILEARKVGGSTWTRTLTNLDPGNYEFRVLGSGVVFGALVSINEGTPIQVGGTDPLTGNIISKAVNIRSENEEVGRFTYPLADAAGAGDSSGGVSFSFNRSACMATLVDSGSSSGGGSSSTTSFSYTVSLLAADTKEQKNDPGSVSKGQITLKTQATTTSTASGTALSQSQFQAACSDQCPYFSSKNEAEIVNPARQVRASGGTDLTRFTDYSWVSNWDHTAPEHVSSRAFKVCENIANVFANSTLRNSSATALNSMSDKQINEDMWANDTQRFTDYFAYQEPECRRIPLFTRGQCGCFAAGTLIRLEDGTEKPIDQLVQSDRVWNPVAKKGQIVRRMTRGPENLPLFLISSQGQEVLVTGTHPFATKKGLLPAYELQIGDEIQSVSGSWGRIDSITVQDPADNPPIVWNLELEGANDDESSHFVEANGIVTGDLLLQERLIESSKHR